MLRFPTSNPDVYVFSRERGGQRVVVLANLSNSATRVKFTGKSPVVKGLVDCFSGAAAALPSELGAWEYRLFTSPLK
jgi:glycosidase